MKIIRIGSSAGVIIPKKQLDELGLRVGDEVEIFVSRPSEITKDLKVIQKAREVVIRYHADFKNLADR